MAKKNRKVVNQLEEDLKTIEKCFNIAKSRISFNSDYRFYGKMVEFFGLKVHDPELAKVPIFIKELKIFRETLEIIIREKYETRRHRLIPETVAGISVIEPAKEIFIDDVLDAEPDIPSRYNPRFKDQEAELLTKEAKQVQAARMLFDNIDIHSKRGQLLLAQTGAGKTYILASLIKNFIEQGLIEKYKCISPWPILYVTKSSIVEQTESVLRDEFNIDTKRLVTVINIEYLRSKVGSVFVDEKLIIKDGQEHYIWRWRPMIHPVLVISDECQILAREMSTQSKIFQGLNDVENLYGSPVFQVFASATPYARVAEAKCFAVSTRTTFHLGLGDVTISNENWKQFASVVASPADPYAYVEAAVERLTKTLDPYIVRVKGIKPKHKAFNSVKRIRFETVEEQQEYQAAWDKFQEEKAKIEGRGSELSASQGRMQILAQLTIFAKAAEKIRRYHIAKFIVDAWNSGKAPIVVVRFKGTITAVVRILIEDYGWTRDHISLIWGGATEALSAKKKMAKKIKNNEEFIKAAMEAGIDFEKDLNIDIDFEEKTESQIAWEKVHDLATQDSKQREREKLKFQRQDSRVGIITYKAGGVGLSMHHEKKYPNARPRETMLTPVYSEKELVQGLGRAPRITSMSDTYQFMVYYGGTIEEAVAARVVMKLKCLKKVIGAHKESWEDIITGRPTITEEHEDTMDKVDEFEQESPSAGNELMEFNEVKDEDKPEGIE